jgi:hypothetical protein
MEAQAIFLYPFTISRRETEKLSLVLLLTKKLTEVIRLQTD